MFSEVNMKIIKEDDTLLKIKQLKDIRSIDFIDLYMNSSKDKVKIIPGFLVFYGRGEELFLTSRDKYFDQFVKKIHETTYIKQFAIYINWKQYVIARFKTKSMYTFFSKISPVFDPKSEMGLFLFQSLYYCS